MEEKREEAKLALETDKERKKKAKAQEERWTLLRTSLQYLEENAEGWRSRRIKEVEKIKAEEKRDGHAVVKVKKKRYGIGKLSKEESIRMRQEQKTGFC